MSKITAGRNVTAGQHSFSQVPSASIQRSVFNRSCGLKTEFDSGLLVPVFVDEALPGDTFSMSMNAFARQATPLTPVLDNAYMDFFFFAVPIRLIWDNWQKFNGEQTNPADSVDFLTPVITDTPAERSMSDYFGIPPGNELTYCSFWHRAYNLIWNEWFRDENLQDSVVVPKGDGPDDEADFVLLRRGKRHDYFSSCLPFRQKGDPVSAPLGDSAPVVLSGTGIPTFDFGSNLDVALNVDSEDDHLEPIGGSGFGPSSVKWNTPNLEADLSLATASTINDIREAFQIQKLLERDARGGSRYTEIIRSHFGVLSPDQRLQRPEYLGGGSTNINVNPVAQTANIGAGSIGELAGYVTASAQGVGFVKSFVEHCVILGFVNVRADITYQQGLERMFSRRTRYDFYWPAFAHLGEQAVLSKEIFADGSSGDDDVFGYQERWAEYRYKPSRTSGQMRSQSVIPLDFWHFGLDFSSRPLLNATFIEDNPPIERSIAVDDAPEYLADFFFNFKCARPMPTFSVPGLVDHF